MRQRRTVVIAANDSTQELVAAATGQIVRVLAFVLSAAEAAASAIFKSATTSISGTIALETGQPLSVCAPPVPGNDAELFVTAVGAALNFTAVNTVGGFAVVEVVTQTP